MSPLSWSPDSNFSPSADALLLERYLSSASHVKTIIKFNQVFEGLTEAVDRYLNLNHRRYIMLTGKRCLRPNKDTGWNINYNKQGRGKEGWRSTNVVAFKLLSSTPEPYTKQRKREEHNRNTTTTPNCIPFFFFFFFSFFFFGRGSAPSVFPFLVLRLGSGD